MSHEFDLTFKLLSLLGSLSLPLLVWLVKVVLRISQSVYGVDGRNGLNGSVRDLKDAKEATGGILREHQGEITRLKTELERTRDHYHDEFVPALSQAASANLKLADALHHVAKAVGSR